VRDIAALTTVEVVESTTIEKGNDFGWLNWARGDRVFMFVVAKIGAGIDFERFYTESFEVDKESGMVTVRMPPAHITYVAIDNSQTQVIDRSTGVFTTGDPKLETDARQVAEKVLRNAAIDAGILERAEKNARTLIEGLLLELGYTRVLFTPPSVTTLSHAMPRIAFAHPVEHPVAPHGLDRRFPRLTVRHPRIERVLRRSNHGRKHRRHGEVGQGECVAR
jgi:hypothetical protein